MSDQSRLPKELLALSPDKQLALLGRMRTMSRAHQGATIVAAVQATLAARSASSYTGEFFANRARKSTVDDASITQHRIEAEMSRLRNGTTALTNRPPPSTACWAQPKFPRTGWELVRIEDTQLPGGAACEVCEHTQMRHSYVLSHPLWPPPLAGGTPGEEQHACRLCAAHLLAAIPPKPPKKASAATLPPPTAAQGKLSPPLHERYPHKYKVPQAKPVDNRARVTLPEV